MQRTSQTSGFMSSPRETPCNHYPGQKPKLPSPPGAHGCASQSSPKPQTSFLIRLTTLPHGFTIHTVSPGTCLSPTRREPSALRPSLCGPLSLPFAGSLSREGLRGEPGLRGARLGPSTERSQALRGLGRLRVGGPCRTARCGPKEWVPRGTRSVGLTLLRPTGARLVA